MDILTSLSKLLLPSEVFDYFTITSVSDHKDEVELFLEEKDIIHKPEKDHEYEKNGFYEEMTVQDYPIRGKRALLRIKRRRWIDRTTGRSFGNDYALVAKGTRHSVEFAAFLKEFLGEIPDYGPLA
jgi:hypothetical protein